MNKKSEKPNTWQYIFKLTVFAGAFSAIFSTLDNIIMHNFIIADDQLTAAFSYLIIGGWVGFISSIFFSKLFGNKLIDKDFSKINFKNKKMHFYAFLSGLIASIGTLFVLLGNQLGDPNMISALGSSIIIYTLFIDMIRGKIKLNTILFPVILVFIGSFLASLNNSISVTLKGIIYIFIISNSLSTLGEFLDQSGVRISDAVNFFIWRFFWLAISGTTIAIIVTFWRGYQSMLVQTLLLGLKNIHWVLLTMFFVFLGIGMKNYAKKTISVTSVLLITSIQIIITFPISLLGNVIFPGLFGNFSNNLITWTLRMIGSAILIIGITLYKSIEDEKISKQP